ncbi:MAG: hypothetical protein M1825_000293 [Sarcosagium campestre]|nr:MAG: hypothetical protein M1825_000293 [Sarcosagium campestre]
MSSIADRRNQQVWEAIGANNQKQALQLCTKRLKKGEKSDYLLALKAYILSKSFLSAQVQEGLRDVDLLVGKEPAISDLGTLKVLESALRKIERHGQTERLQLSHQPKELTARLWERAVKAKSGDEALCREWFFSAFRLQDWRSAQKAGGDDFAEGVHSKARILFLGDSLLSSTTDSSESERKLFGTLAYRMISKAASDVPADPNTLLSPGRSVQTPQELQLLIAIYRKQGHLLECLRILDSSNLGISSRVAKGDWSLVRAKLDILEELNLWHEEWKFCKGLIKDAQSTSPIEHGEGIQQAVHTQGDDWRVWQGLIKANREIGEHVTHEETLQTAKEFCNRSLKSRNARLAQLDLSQTYPDSESPPEPSELLLSCQRYFDDFSGKTYCSDDLCKYVERLNNTEQVAFADYRKLVIARLNAPSETDELNRVKHDAAKVNDLKLDFPLRISPRETQQDPAVLTGYVRECVQTCKSFSQPLNNEGNPDHQLGDDTCVLAAMGIIHVSNLESSDDDQVNFIRALQSAAVLEFVITRSKDHYQALLLLVRLHCLLGTGSMAMQKYRQLSIKKVQQDTLAHNLYSRFSTIHPRGLPPSTTSMDLFERDPQAALERALGFYERSTVKIKEMRRLALEQGSYGQVDGICELGDRIERSLCRLVWQVERKRTQRLTKTSVWMHDKEEESTFSASPRLADNRDYDVMTSYERLTAPKFEEYVRVGPRPGQLWATSFSVSELLISELESVRHTAGKPLPSSLDNIRDAAQKLKNILDDQNLLSELTTSEKAYINLQLFIAEKSSKLLRSDALDITNELSGIERRLKEDITVYESTQLAAALDKTHLSLIRSPLSWTTLHKMFLDLDGLKILSLWLDDIADVKEGGRDKISVNLVRKLQGLIVERYEQIRSAAMAIKDRLSESGVLGLLVDLLLGRLDEGQDVIGVALDDLVGEPWMETFVSNVVDSWQDALDGVLGVKLN